MSGAGGLGVRLGGLRELAERIASLSGGGNLAKLENQIARVALPWVMASERARWDNRRTADGGSWSRQRYSLNKTGALKTSMTMFRVEGSKLAGRMVYYGRWQYPPDFWPSPMPLGVAQSLERAAKLVLNQHLLGAGKAAA